MCYVVANESTHHNGINFVACNTKATESGPKSCKVNFNRNNEGGRIRSKVRKEKYGGIDDDDESHMVFVLQPTIVRACKSEHACIREEKACNLDYSHVEDVHEFD